MTGHIIVLNGPSSAGKSTLATVLRERVGSTMAAVSIDRLFPFMHQDAPASWRAFATLTDATFRCAAALADGGFDVVVDTVFERAACLEIMCSALGDRPHHLVAVTAPPNILEERERQRGDRRKGQAREQHERGVLHGARYDLVLDTHAQPIEICVNRIAALLPVRSRP